MKDKIIMLISYVYQYIGNNNKNRILKERKSSAPLGALFNNAFINEIN